MLESMQNGWHSFSLNVARTDNWLATGAVAKPTGDNLSIAHYILETVVASIAAAAVAIAKARNNCVGLPVL